MMDFEDRRDEILEKAFRLVTGNVDGLYFHTVGGFLFQRHQHVGAARGNAYAPPVGQQQFGYFHADA